MSNRFHQILNDIANHLSEAAQKTYKGQKRSDLKDSDFLFPESRSFPIVTPQDVPDAISNFGRMKGDMSYEAFLSKLYKMAKRKGPAFVAALPDASKQQLGIKKKTEVADATILPVPVVQIAPKQETNTRVVKTDFVDETNNDSESQKQKTYINKLVPSNPNTQVSLPNSLKSTSACKLKAGDLVKNINKACMHYGSEGTVENIEDLPDHMGQVVVYKTTNSGPTWKVGDILKKTENQLTNLQMVEDEDMMEEFDEMPDDEEDEEEDSSENELDEYKEDFYEMSLGSLRAIATHANEILNALDKPYVKENLTESWLQGKIAITEDYMRTIHDFIMYVSDAADNVSAADRPGLWENIRRKKQREGKNYKAAKPGDKDRPNKEQWNKLTK